jgi:hypothetical protein
MDRLLVAQKLVSSPLPRARPKLKGYVAFIALVVVLGIIAILASIGIYYLIRDREPSDKDRAARRKYSIRGDGARKHSLPIGLPSSFSEKISSIFSKSRRSGKGWVSAKDEEADEWDSKDEPVHYLPDLPYDPVAKRELYPRVGEAPSSHRTTLTEVPENLYKSRTASHVEYPSSQGDDFARLGPPPPMSIPFVHVQAPSAPDEVWLNAHDGSRGGPGSVSPGGRMGYHAPQPRRADSGPEIPLFAGSTPFRQDIY